MAVGRDASQNLGGMLSNIGTTMGESADAFKPVLQAATKPRGDMNDPAHLQRLAQWASSNGDTQSAAMYMSQARELKAETKKVADATLLNGATAAYKAARESGVAEDIASAEQALIDASNATGQNAHVRLDAVQSSLNEAEDRARLLTERQEAAKEKAALEQFTTELNAVSDPEEIAAIVEAADPSVSPIAQRAATLRLDYLNKSAERAEKDALNNMEVDTTLAINEDLPPNVVKAHKAELASIEKMATDGYVNGTWNPGVRAEVIRRRDALAEKIYRATHGKEMTDYGITSGRRRTYNGKAASVAVSTPSPKVAKEIRKELEQAAETEAEKGKNVFQRIGQDRADITVEQVNAEFRRQQMVALRAEFDDVLNPEGTPAGTVKTREQHIEDAKKAHPNKTEAQVIAALIANGTIAE